MAVRGFSMAGRVSFRPGDEGWLKASCDRHNAVNAALATGVRRSSTFIGGGIGPKREGPETGQRTPVSETADWADGAGASPYGVSKHAAEMEAWRGMAEGLEVIVVNPTIILGDARYGESSGMVFRRAAEGRRHYPAGGGGFVGVTDLLAVCALMRGPTAANRASSESGSSCLQRMCHTATS